MSERNELPAADNDDCAPLSDAEKNVPHGAEWRHQQAEIRHDPEAIRKLFLSGEYPYHSKMANKEYEAKKMALQVELLKVQAWVKESGQKIVLTFEGRDAAGKGGTIKRFMEHLNPRGARVVALEKPSEQERDRTACMMHFLASLDYPNKDTTVVRAPDPLIVGHSQHSMGRANHILGPSLSQW